MKISTLASPRGGRWLLALAAAAAAACGGGGDSGTRVSAPAPALKNMTISPSPTWVGDPTSFSAQCVSTTTDTLSTSIAFGDQHSTSSLSGTHTYTQAGTYTVVFTCIDTQLNLQTQQSFPLAVNPTAPTGSGSSPPAGGGGSSSSSSSSGGGSSSSSSSSSSSGGSSGSSSVLSSRLSLGDGSATSLMIRADGSVITAGFVLGGDPTAISGTTAELIQGAGSATAVVVDGGQETSFAIAPDGAVTAWGQNAGPLGPLSDGALAPLTDNLFNTYLGLNAGNTPVVTTPVNVPQLDGAVQIQPVLGVLIELSTDGVVSIVPGKQTLDLTGNVLSGSPLAVTGLGTITSLGTPSQQQLFFPVIDTQGNVTIITVEPYNLVTGLVSDALGTSYSLTAVTGLPAITQVACGDASSGPFCLALAQDGSVWAWGSNDEGELGNGTTVAASTPAQISFPGVTIKQVAANTGNAYAVASDGTVYAWGKLTGVGQSTSGAAASTFYVPNLVPNLSGIVEIAARGTDVLALDSQGNVWGWGTNSSGELGQPAGTTVVTPTQFPGINLN